MHDKFYTLKIKVKKERVGNIKITKRFIYYMLYKFCKG